MLSTTTISFSEFDMLPGQHKKETYQVSLDGRTVRCTSGHIAPKTYGTDAEALDAYVKLALARPSNSSFPHVKQGTWLEPTDDQGRSLGQLSTESLRQNA